MASQAKRLWLHDEDNTIKVLPVTTIDNIKVQPDLSEDEFYDFIDDYNDTKTTITNNKNETDRSLNNLDTRVTILENAGGGGSGSSGIGLATPSSHGLMSKQDKEKLDDIADRANRYILPVATANTLGGVKPDGTTVVVDENGVISTSASNATLENLSDVNVRALLDGDLLAYDSASRKWVNVLPEEVGAGGGNIDVEYISFDDIISLFNTDDTTYIYNLNKTY